MPQSSFLPSDSARPASSVECLGMSFASDEERRTYFLERLREKLRDPEFRKIEGFPIGSDEDILALSDPPYYTACPNPFITDFIRSYGRPYDPAEPYSREPFAADVSEGKNDPIYNAHSYHTKVPHKAIMRYILHYTQPGDVILDGFCGTGMTGVAAQMCGNPDPEFRAKIEQEWKNSGQNTSPDWGTRLSILNDLSPLATFIAYNYNIPFDAKIFQKEAMRVLTEVKAELSWMYETYHSDGQKGVINYTVWSDVFICPECASEVVFWDSAVDKIRGEVLDQFPCANCNTRLSKRSLSHAMTVNIDKALGTIANQVKIVPVLINYSVGKNRHEKQPDQYDLELISRIEHAEIPCWFPVDRMPVGDESRRNDDLGITSVHHYYTRRSLAVLSVLFSKAQNPYLMMALIDGHSVGTRMSRFRVSAWVSKTTGPMKGLTSGTLYVPSLFGEQSWVNIFNEKVSMILRANILRQRSAFISTGHAGKLAPSDSSVDYIFIDPPFGANIWYSDLNFLGEAWLKIHTNNKNEAVESKAQRKQLSDYQYLMEESFREFFRILKPGRWMTVEFSNTKAAVWNAIQTSLERAGFVVANVAALDKQQLSFKAVTTPTAVKQDLVISCYKPNGGLEDRVQQDGGSEVSVWEFIRSHLRYLPNFLSRDGIAVEIVERTPRILYDRLVAYFVQHSYPVPLSAPEFQRGVEERFACRDGMYFLEDQIPEYERQRMSVRQIQQLQIFVNDEASAIQWAHQQLINKPQTAADLTPPFLSEITAWQKYEQMPELRSLLDENFLNYTGSGPIPTQIVAWMRKSAELRKLIEDELSSDAAIEEVTGLKTNNPRLLASARDRWYVPDPNKAIDLENLRLKSLLKEFTVYNTGKGKLKLFRTEVVRAGFKHAYNQKDFATIVHVAERLPEHVIEEDQALALYYYTAMTKL